MCRFCTHVVHERVQDFEEPNCSMIRRWYASEYVQDELDPDHKDEFYLFERRYLPERYQTSSIWYLSCNGAMLLPINNCPKCGRDLV